MNLDKTTNVENFDKPSVEELSQFDPDKRIDVQAVDEGYTESMNDFNADDRLPIEYDEVDSQPSQNIDTSDKKFYDDNGVKYRDGDHLIPNNHYELNGYKYETDDKGRIISSEGTLKIIPPHDRKMEKDINTIGKGYERETDDKGHLIGHQFGGDDRLGNLVAQDSKENQGAYKALEDKLADAVKSGKKVTVDIKVDYLQGSHRPSKIVYTYTIDGNISQQTFKNRSSS